MDHIRFEQAEKVGDLAWSHGLGRPFLSRAWMAMNTKILRAQALHLMYPRSSDPWLVPALEVDDRSYRYFVPRNLLAELLRRVPQYDLASFIEEHVSAPALICAIPLAYASPLWNLPVGAVDSIADVLEKAAKAQGRDVVAFLYLDPSDAGALARLEERGYLVTLLDANGVVEIEDHWHCLDDYFRDQRNGRELRREHRRFTEAGYVVKWHQGVPTAVIAEAVRLEGALLRTKGHDFSDDELFEWYEGVAQIPGDTVLTCVVSRRQGHGEVNEACVVFVRDAQTLVGKAIGLADARRHFLYFNVGYYEPIRYAISNNIEAIDLGPSTQDAKRRRGARGRALLGAFRFDDPVIRQRWPEISATLHNKFTTSWGRR